MRLRLICGALLLLGGTVLAADWPQWRGPNRDDLSKETGLLKTWPKGGPKLLWTADTLGMGYSGPAVVGETLYILGSDETTEYLYALSTKDGKRQWEAKIGGFYDNRWGGGPRGTPTVDGDHVYALGGQGKLICAEKKGGKVVWQVDLVGDLGGRRNTWGYTESPLIDGDKLICTPGGKRGTLAALNKKTGKSIWRSAGWTDIPAYSSVVISTAHKKRQYVQMTESTVGGVDADTGKVLWTFERQARITIPTPITTGNHVYVASGYGKGSNLLELKAAEKVEEVWQSRVMQNHHGGVILLGEHLYGYCDRNGWTCQKLKDGEVASKWNKLGKGSIAYADGLFYCYAERDGTVALMEANKDGWTEKGRFSIKQSQSTRPPNARRGNIWTHPVIANGKLYLRDQEMLYCYDVKAEK